jgi:hypothetical protein
MHVCSPQVWEPGRVSNRLSAATPASVSSDYQLSSPNFTWPPLTVTAGLDKLSGVGAATSRGATSTVGEASTTSKDGS